MIHARDVVPMIAVSAMLVVAIGCGPKAAPPAPAPPPPPAAAAAPPPPPPPPPAPAPAPAPAALTDEQIFAKKTLEQLNAEKPLGDVFFDLDQSTVRADARPSLQTNADWIYLLCLTKVTI
jgi:hypothetical protein